MSTTTTTVSAETLPASSVTAVHARDVVKV
jgi:hypothetical protein